ncbi:hypothetical protein CPC08DRAFT_727771 [Agrocybe pediades]|nr:hypothetical protein CPC08DRAFT_727771 [Agrocybe pediades]
MGQFWWFVNIDKRQEAGCMREMNDFIFGVDAIRIAGSIAVPAKSPWLSLKKLEKGAGAWAGDRILCIGSDTTKWPDNILAEVTSGCWFTKSLEDPQAFLNNAKHEPPYIPPLLSQRPDPHYPEDKTWVLRNLDKKIYICSNVGIPTEKDSEDGSPKVLKYDGEPGLFAIPGLGSVLVTKMGWSQNPSCSVAWREAASLTRGEWIGDRVDVRLLEDVEVELSKPASPWIDDTEKEAKKIREIWQAAGNKVEID